MDSRQIDWGTWRRFYEQRSDRPLPKLASDMDYSHLPDSLAKSLAIFQLGESGGGTIVEQARLTSLPGTNSDYADAMALFVKEEHRHANVLAMCVRLLGGRLIQKNWTAYLFVFVRRLMGVRLKVLVLLAAEVVGICYYHLLASQLPPCHIKRWLLQLVEDEQSHLYFHCDFLRSQVRSAGQRRVFRAVWRNMMFAAAVAVIIDHRHAIKDMGLDIKTVWRRWRSFSQLAENLVTRYTATHLPEESSLPAQSALPVKHQVFASTPVQ